MPKAMRKRSEETNTDDMLVDLTYILGELCDMETWEVQNLREELREKLRTRITFKARRNIDTRLLKMFTENHRLVSFGVSNRLRNGND